MTPRGVRRVCMPCCVRDCHELHLPLSLLDYPCHVYEGTRARKERSGGLGQLAIMH